MWGAHQGAGGVSVSWGHWGATPPPPKDPSLCISHGRFLSWVLYDELVKVNSVFIVVTYRTGGGCGKP